MSHAITLRNITAMLTELPDDVYLLAVAADHSERTGSKLPADKPSAPRRERDYTSERIKMDMEAPM